MYYKAVDTLINLKPGVQHMDGKTALGYARFRHDAIGDFGSSNGEELGRVVRQKALLKAVMAQTTALRNVWKLPPVIRAIESAVVTDLLPNDMLRIALAFKNTTDKEVTTIDQRGPRILERVEDTVKHGKQRLADEAQAVHLDARRRQARG